MAQVGLEAAYPNPFRSATSVSTIRSRRRSTEPGVWEHALDGRVLAAGPYAVRVTSASGASAVRHVVRVA